MEAGTAPAGEELEREIAELLERDTFEPPPGFADKALFSDESPYEEAAADPEAWWAEQAEALDWDKRWDIVLDESEAPFYKWFTGGKLNASHNCLDRHVEAGNGDRVAFHWRGEEGEERDVTYADLLPRRPAPGERAEGARDRQGRRGGDLPADDPRGGGGHAGVRADRGAPQRGVRGLLTGQREGADGVLGGQGADHRPTRRGARARRRRSSRRSTSSWATCPRSRPWSWSRTPATTSR